MFDIPQAKRIRRSDLTPSPPPHALNAEAEAQLHARLALIYGNSIALMPPSIPDFANEPEDKEPNNGDKDPLAVQAHHEEGFEFRLFGHGTYEGVVEATKIVLKTAGSEDGVDGRSDGGFLSLRDPRTFVVGKATGEQLSRFEAAAISGEQVQWNAGKRARGLEVPWRVTVLRVKERRRKSAGDEVTDIRNASMDGLEGRSRKRPGKKRRIIMRSRMKASGELAEKMKMAAALREEAEREKRTRRNREKKIKRRIKEKGLKSNQGVVDPGSCLDVNDNGD